MLFLFCMSSHLNMKPISGTSNWKSALKQNMWHRVDHETVCLSLFSVSKVTKNTFIGTPPGVCLCLSVGSRGGDPVKAFLLSSASTADSGKPSWLAVMLSLVLLLSRSLTHIHTRMTHSHNRGTCMHAHADSSTVGDGGLYVWWCRGGHGLAGSFPIRSSDPPLWCWAQQGFCPQSWAGLNVIWSFTSAMSDAQWQFRAPIGSRVRMLPVPPACN